MVRVDEIDTDVDSDRGSHFDQGIELHSFLKGVDVPGWRQAGIRVRQKEQETMVLLLTGLTLEGDGE